MTDNFMRCLTMAGLILDSGKESNVVCGGCFDLNIPCVRVADIQLVVLVMLSKSNDSETLGRTPKFPQKTNKQSIVTATPPKVTTLTQSTLFCFQFEHLNT